MNKDVLILIVGGLLVINTVLISFVHPYYWLAGVFALVTGAPYLGDAWRNLRSKKIAPSEPRLLDTEDDEHSDS